jgi:hypothetical protein
MAKVERWRRFGHDRLYVEADDGTSLGFVDLKTGESRNVVPSQAEEFHAAVERWRADTSPAPPRSDGNQTKPRPPRQRKPPTAQASADSPQPDLPSVVAEADLAANQPGQAAAEVAAAYREAAPLGSFVARLIGRHTEERAWRIGAAGEVETARRLRVLTDPTGRASGANPPWRILHSIPVGNVGTDIDHLLIGPPGVFTINTKTHPGKLVWANPTVITIDKRPTRYAEAARSEANRAARALTTAVGVPVQVFPVISVVDGTAGGRYQPHGVTVLPVKRLVDWLLQQPASLTAPWIERLYAVARRASTWNRS